MRFRAVAAVAAVVLLAGCSSGEGAAPLVAESSASSPGADVCQLAADSDLRGRVEALGWDASETLDNAYYERVSDLDAEIAALLPQAREAVDVHAALTGLREPLQAIRQGVNSGAETLTIDASTMVTAGTALMGACADAGVDLG